MDKALRIAQVCVHACPLRFLGAGALGGMNVYVRELTRALAQRGVNVDIFTLWHDGLHAQDITLADSVRFIHIEAGEGRNIPKEATFELLPQFTSEVLGFTERNGLKYDLIHSHYWLSAWVAERLKPSLGIPHITTFHTLAEVKERTSPGHQEPQIRKQAEAEVACSAERVIALTREERRDLADLYKASPEKVQVIPGGVDLSLFKPVAMAEARARLGTRAAKVLLFVGRIDPAKGLDTLLRAFALLQEDRDVCLIVVGGNATGHDETARLKALSGELGIADRVEFRGPVGQRELPLYYSAANVTVVPSHHESFGLVAIESLACGTPVVASNRGGLGTTVKDGENGFLVEELSPGAFAKQVLRVLDDEGMEAGLRARARGSVRKYSWNAVGAAVLREYEGLCQKAPTRTLRKGE